MKIRKFLTVASVLSALLLALPSVSTAQEVKPLRIMCIGASITMGQGLNGGYRLPLEKMFEGAGIPVQFVGRIDWNSKGMTWPFHDGYPGHRIDQIENGATNQFKITSLPIADGVRDQKPDAVLLFCGTNDVRQNYKLSEAPERLDHLIGIIQSAAPDAQILVSSLTPDLHFDDAIRRYNQGVAAVVAKRAANGQKVRFVDGYNAVSSGTDLLPDRTHLNAAGYTKIARNWFNALVPNAPQVAFGLSADGANEFAAKSCMGYQVTMKRPTTITELGIYTSGKALNERHAVGVFDESGQVLAKAEIGPEDTLSGLFTYKKLATPLKLEAGKSYIFVANCVGISALVGTNALIDPLSFDNPRFYFDHNVATDMEEKDGTLLKFPGTKIRDINGALGYFGPIFRMAP